MLASTSAAYDALPQSMKKRLEGEKEGLEKSREVNRPKIDSLQKAMLELATQLSEIMQINLHRALTRQAEPAAALARAQAEMQRLLDRVGLGTGAPVARR